MRPYETVFILQSDLDEETKENLLEKIKDVIQKNGGEISQQENWGKKKLAYTINKTHKEGDYYLINFAGDSQVLSELDHVFKMNTEILRSLVVRADQ